jgi:glycosyltransferase involved in cell wall biosynthesis
LSNAGVGDVKSILENNNIGIAINSFETEEKRQAIESLLSLCSDPEIVDRCRSIAESYYSLGSGVNEYNKIYHSMEVEND